jgi:hypothetical protein
VATAALDREPNVIAGTIGVKLYGLFYEISSGKLIEVVRDIPAQLAA